MARLTSQPWAAMSSRSEQLAADQAADDPDHDVEHQTIAGAADQGAGDPAGNAAGNQNADGFQTALPPPLGTRADR